MIVLSLCDHTGVAVHPWAEAGYECVCVDTRNSGGSNGKVHKVAADVRHWLPDCRPEEIAIVMCWPPCTNLSVSGARWFKDKGLRGLIDGLEVVESCRRLCEWLGCPWFIENPVSTLSTYWRKPDYTFHPWQYGDGYTKKTCLWTGGGFKMPPPTVTEQPADVDDRIHKMSPGPERGHLRSVTPAGFARAVFESNSEACNG